MDVGPGEALIILVPAVIALGVAIWAIVDAIGRPSDKFILAGQSKAVWLVLMIGFTLACGFIGVLLAIYYLLAVRPKVAAA